MAALGVAACVAGCAGPRPLVSDVHSTASPVPGCVRVEGVLQNRGGAGEVEVRAHLVDPARGLAFEARRSFELARRARIGVVVDVPAPPGGYVATLTAHYPKQ
jgi:hypothetical protein